MDMLALIKTPIIIHTDLDLTPRGTRRAQVVHHNRRGRKCAPHIKWFVGGKTYRSLDLNDDNLKLSAEWVKARTKTPAQ